jgi:competence protein ComGC
MMHGQDAHAWTLFEVLLVVLVLAVVLGVTAWAMWPEIVKLTGHLGTMWRKP